MSTFTSRYSWLLKWIPIVVLIFSAIAWAVKADFRIATSERVLNSHTEKIEVLQSNVSSLKEDKAGLAKSVEFLVVSMNEFKVQMTEVRADIKKLLSRDR